MTNLSQRFTSLTDAFDVESLSHLCKLLYTYEITLDIMALHTRISDMIFYALLFLEQYDCETVGTTLTSFQPNFINIDLNSVTR